MNKENLLTCLKNSITPDLYDDVKELIEKLEAENKRYQESYLDTRQELYKRDVEAVNNQKALEVAKESLEGLTVENHHLRELMKIYVSRI